MENINAPGTPVVPSPIVTATPEVDSPVAPSPAPERETPSPVPAPIPPAAEAVPAPLFSENVETAPPTEPLPGPTAPDQPESVPSRHPDPRLGPAPDLKERTDARLGCHHRDRGRRPGGPRLHRPLSANETDKPKRLEAANFERAEAAIRWDVAENRADATGLASDRVQAEERDAELSAADRKIQKVASTP